MADDGVSVLIRRLQSAINRHDVETFVECFHEDYRSEQPLSPERSFRGRDYVREIWSANVTRVPDLRWDLLASAYTADAAWCEWRWRGTRVDGARFDVQGVIIYGIEDGRIARGRLYMGDLPDRF